MRKTVIAALGVLIASGLGVLAQSGDPITQRQNLMKNNQEQMRTLTGMARGQAPFNAATAQAAFQRLEQNAQAIPAAVPARLALRARPRLFRSSGSAKPISTPMRPSSGRMPRRSRPRSRIRPACRLPSSGWARIAAAVTRPIAGKTPDERSRALRKNRALSVGGDRGGRSPCGIPRLHGFSHPRDGASDLCRCLAPRPDGGRSSPCPGRRCLHLHGRGGAESAKAGLCRGVPRASGASGHSRRHGRAHCRDLRGMGRGPPALPACRGALDRSGKHQGQQLLRGPSGPCTDLPMAGTSISEAIDFSLSLLSSGHFLAARRVIDISGDGSNNQGPLVTEARDQAIAQGVTINGLPITLREPDRRENATLDAYYRDCVIGGSNAFMIPVRERKQFLTETRAKIVREIAGAAGLVSPVQSVGVWPRTDCDTSESLWDNPAPEPHAPRHTIGQEL